MKWLLYMVGLVHFFNCQYQIRNISNTHYIDIGVAAAIAVFVGGIVLSSQSHIAASAGKVQYPQNGLNQNPGQNAHDSQYTGGNNAPRL